MTSEKIIQHETSTFEIIHAKLDQIHEGVQRDQDLQTQLHRLLDETGTKMDLLATILTELKLPSQDVCSSTTFPVSNEDMLRRIVRTELQNVLLPTVRRVSKPQIQDERMLRAVNRTMDSMSQEVSQMASIQRSFLLQESSTDRVPTPSASTALQLSGKVRPHVDQQLTFSPEFVNGSTQHLRDNVSRALIFRSTRKPAILSRQAWCFNWRIGRLYIRLSTFRARGTSSAYFEVVIRFIPSSSWMALPGISVSCTDAPNQQGYYQICPLISIIPVIPKDAFVWKCINESDLKGLQNLFAKGLASPRDQDEQGEDLLLVFPFF